MADLFDEFQIGQPSIPQAETGDLLDEFSITPPEPESKGVTGHIRDLGVSALSGTVLVPEAAVGFMDMQTRGRMGKRLEDAGFRPKEAKETINTWHTDQFKEQQQLFADADGVVEKTQVALENPSLIGNAVAESLPLMGAGAVAARGMLRAAPGLAKTKTGTAVAAAAGEGAMMAGSQAEAIRQQTADGLMTGEQVGASVATGGAGALFGFAGARLAQKLGIGDVDTMLASGVKPAQVAAELAATPAKSVPRQVIEGAITEGFLEELPQSVSEQILQNLALNKPWSEGVDDAAVMGTLAGMAMGGPAAGYNALSAPVPQPAPQINPEAEAQGGTEQAPAGTPPSAPAVDAGVPPMPAAPLANAAAPVAPTPAPAVQVTPAPAPVQPKPSEQMGLNPNAGALSAAAAIAVDTGASPAVVVAEQPAEQPVRGSLKRAADLAAQGAQADAAPSWVQDWQESLGQPAPEVNPLTGEIAPAGSDLLAAAPAADLQDRLSHIQKQAKATGWNADLIAQRDKLKAELDALPTSATPKATTGMQGDDHPAVAGWLTKRLSDFKEKYQIPDGADIDATIEQNIDSPNAARAGRARVMRSGLNDLRKELDAARAWLQANPDQASALTADAQLDYANPVSSLEFYKTGQRPRSMADDAREAAGYGPASGDQPAVKDANIERQREDKRLLARPSAQMVGEAESLGVQDADKYRNVQALEFAMAEARKAPTPQQPADQAVVSPETVTAPATAEASIKAITAKQIPQMTDAELAQAIAHYGPDNKRTAKLQKEQAKRASAPVAPGDAVRVSDGLGSDIDGMDAKVIGVNGDSATLEVGGERYQDVPLSEITKTQQQQNQQPEITDGVQAPQAQQAGPQPAQVAGQAPAADAEAAGTASAGSTAGVDHGARWEAMSRDERQELAAKSGVKPVFVKTLPGAPWGRIGEATRQKLIAAMGDDAMDAAGFAPERKMDKAVDAKREKIIGILQKNNNKAGREDVMRLPADEVERLSDMLSRAEAMHGEVGTEASANALKVVETAIAGTISANALGQSVANMRATLDQSPRKKKAAQSSAQGNAGTITDALASVAEAQRAIAADWESRVYKKNKTRVELHGDGPRNTPDISISAANESRRQRAIEAANKTAEGAERLIAEISERGEDAFMERMERLRSKVESDADFEAVLLNELKFRGPDGRGNIESNDLSRTVLAQLKARRAKMDAAAAENDASFKKAVQAVDKGADPFDALFGDAAAKQAGEQPSARTTEQPAEPAASQTAERPGADGRIFGYTPEQLGARQGGGMDSGGQWYDPEAKAKRDQEEAEDRRKLVERQKAENEQRHDEATRDPRIKALADAGLPLPQVLNAAKELREGDDSLVLDLARINGIELPAAAPKAEADSAMTPEEAARYLKDFVYSLGNLDGMTDSAQIELSSPLGKSGRDTLLMEAFGISREQAHEINNRLDAIKPRKLRREDMQEAFDVFPSLRKLVSDAIEAAAKRDSAKTIEAKQADEYAARLRKLGDEFQGSYSGRSLAPLARAMADHAIEQGRRLTDAEIADLGKRFDVPADVVEQLTGNIFTFDALLGAAQRREPGAVALRKRQSEVSITTDSSSKAAAGKPAEYGSNNKLVTADRAAELRAKLAAKLNGSQLNSGLDPEILAMGTELAIFHLEASARRFAEFARLMADDLGQPLEKIRPYLRGWYNGARDNMEDQGASIDGMDNPDEVRAALAELDAAPAAAEATDQESDAERVARIKATPPAERTDADLDWYVDYRQRTRDESAARAGEAEAESKAATTSASLDSYVKDMAPNVAALAIKSLNKQIRIDGKAATLREHIEAWHAAGELSVSTSQEPRIKPMSRRDFNRATNAEQRMHEKRMQEAGSKTVYYVNDYDLGKTAHDYAAALLRDEIEPDQAVSAATQESDEAASITPEVRFERLRSEGHGEMTEVLAFAKVAGATGEKPAEVYNRWQSVMGFMQAAEKGSGKDLSSLMGRALVKEPYKVESAYPGSNPPAVSDLASAQRFAERTAKAMESFNKDMALNDARTFDAERFGVDAALVKAARDAIQQMRQTAAANERAAEQLVKDAEAREKSEAEAEEQAKKDGYSAADLREFSIKPTAAQVKNWFTGAYKGKTAYSSNGHILDISGTEPHLKGWGERLDKTRTSMGEVAIDNLIHRAEKQPGVMKIEPLALNHAPELASKKHAVFSRRDDDKAVYIDLNYARYFLSKFKGAEFFTGEPSKNGDYDAIQVKHNGELVGIVMPIRMREDGRSPNEIRGYMKASGKDQVQAKSVVERVKAVKAETASAQAATDAFNADDAALRSDATAKPAAQTISREEAEQELARQLFNAWDKQAGDVFTTNTYYPATLNLNGKTRQMAMFKKKAGGTLYAVALDTTIYGPVFTTYRVHEGKLIEDGTRNLFAHTDTSREQQVAEFKALFETAGTQQAVENPAAEGKPEGKRSVIAKVAEAKAQAVADYFAPGNVVPSYGGNFDRVISYQAPDKDGHWSVTVRAVEKRGDSWVDKPGERERNHMTLPDARELKAGPVGQVEQVEADVAPQMWHTELPQEGIALTKEQRDGKVDAYRAISGMLATDAVNAITPVQLTNQTPLYLHVLPEANGRNGIARFVPDDQTVPAPWKKADDKPLSYALTREQMIYRATESLRNQPIIGSTAKAQAAEAERAGSRRDPKAVSMFNPYLDGDVVSIDGQDWTVRQDMPGWYLTNTGNWRGQHPSIHGIKAMADLIREVEQAATAQPADAAQDDAAADFPLKEAADSYSGISHSGRARAKADAEEYARYIDDARESGLAVAHTDAQKAAVAQAVADLRVEYLANYRRLMSVRAGTYSGHVAGRSGLNGKQANQRNNAYDRAIETFTAWQSANTHKARKAALDARTEDEKAADKAAADQAREDKAQKERDADLTLMRKILSWKKGGEPVAITKTAVLDGVNKGRDGYPTSIKLKPIDGSTLLDDKFDLAALFRDRKRGESVPDSKRRVRELVDAVRAEAATEAAQEAQEQEQAPAKADSTIPLLQAHEAAMEQARDGKIEAEAFRAAFAQVEGNREAILAELNSMNKEKLLRAGGVHFYHRYKSEKKDRVVEALYRSMLDEYALGKSYGPTSYMMTAAGMESHRQAKAQALRDLVAGTDADALSQYAAEVAELRKERESRKEATQKALTDPQTLAEFRSAITYNAERHAETRREAYLRLTPEQRRRYDALEAESTREARDQAKARQRTKIASAGNTTAGEVIATKHTKHGHDLFVVKLEERVSREDYDTLNNSAKRMGGSYSSYRGNGAIPGFQFRTREAAEAFRKLVAGDTAAAQEVAQARRDAFEDDRSQSAVERLRTMAAALNERADEELGRDRKVNTARRARMASAAEGAANANKALAGTMSNIADAIEAGKAKFLDLVRQKVQVEFLNAELRNAKDAQIRAKYPSYADQERHRGQPIDDETVDYSTFPTYGGMRSDLAGIARQMIEVDGLKNLGQRLLKVADDVSDAYVEWAKNNLLSVSRFARGEQFAEFTSRDDAERAIRRSNLSDRAIVLPLKRGVNRIVLSPSEAMKQGIWQGDDKRIGLSGDFGREIVEAVGRRAGSKIKLPWQLETVHAKRKRLEGMGIYTGSEYRAALREFADLQQAMATPDKIKQMERAMIGRRSDGLDFFPTSEAVVDAMLEAAEITDGMGVLEPSAGMGHIADAIREKTGVEPDVVELSGERRELLQAKGYHLAGDDFMAMQPRSFYTFGDVFQAPDGTKGIMHGGAAWSGRASLHAINEDGSEGKMLGWYDRDELTGIEQRGSWSGYDRIVMNPPFSKGRDIQHVQHAYSLLKPGGRLVAIMGEGAFFQSNSAAEGFRAWLDDLGATSERLPENSFMDAALPVNTAVNARMVVIDKPATDTSGITADSARRAAVRARVAANNDNRADEDFLQGMLKALYEKTGDGVLEHKLSTWLDSRYQRLEAVDQLYAEYDKAFAGKDEVLFSRRPVNVTGATRTVLSHDAVKAIVERINARLALGTELAVYRSEAALFAAAPAIEQQAEQDGAKGEIKAVYHDGKVHVVTSAFAGNADVETAILDALAHEGQGHYGIRAMFAGNKPAIDAALREVFAAIGGVAGVKRLAAKNGIDLSSYLKTAEGMSERQRAGYLADELLAHLQGKAATAGLTQRAVNAIKEYLGEIRNWLREHGFVALAKVNDADIALLLKRMREASLRNGTTAPGAARFSRSSQQTDSEAFRRWFGDSKTLNKDGEPQVLYHGTAADFTVFDQSRAGSATGHSTSALGIFMSSDRRAAEQYAEKAGDGIPGYGKVMELYASIRNPYLMTVEESQEIENPLQARRLRSKLEQAGHDGIRLKGTPVWIAFNNYQVKSATDNNGDFDEFDPDIRFSRSSYRDMARNAADAIASVSVQDVKRSALGKWTDFLSLGLQSLGRRQLVDLYDGMLPMRKYAKLVERMDADKNDTGAAADELAQRWGKLKDGGKLADLMHEATLAQTDADPLVPESKAVNPGQRDALIKRFEQLTPEAQAIYREARDAYKDHHRSVIEAIKERVKRSEMGSERKEELLRKMDSEFYKAIQGVYFPLARFGSYVVAVNGPDGKIASVHRAETMGEANALRDQLQQKFPRDSGYDVGKVTLDKEFVASRDSVSRGFMSELYGALDGMNLPSSQLAELEDTLGQLYLASMPDLSWAKHGIHRKGTAGFSDDARRAFAQNMFHGARYLAKLRYGDRMQDELDRMQKHADARKHDADYDQPKAQRVIDEMVKRHESMMNPKSNPLSTALTSFGFIYYLGLSPAAAVVNLTQTALVAYPVMGAKWGFNKSAAALMKASNQAVRGKNDITQSLTPEELKAFEKAVRDGTIDVTQAHDLAGIAQGEDSKVMWKIRPVMRMASFMFHQAEVFNRQVTFVASYRLAREAGASTTAAYEQAKKATYDGHFDYSASNRPRLMQGNVAKVVLLFKQYAQNMLYTLTRNAYQSVAGESPAVRKEAQKTIGAILALHAAATGVLGLPLVGTMLALASAVGGDDDDPWDAEAALRNLLADALGPKASEVIARGLSRLGPADISGRVALNSLLLPDVQEGLEGKKLAEAWTSAMLGPVAGIFTNAAVGANHIAEGRYAMGLESMLPVALRNPLKSLRYADEGVVDRSGVVVRDEVGAAGIVSQLLGFSPSEVRLSFEGKSAVFDADRRLSSRRSELMAQFAQAAMEGDQGGMAEARAAIATFNQKNPSRRIQANHLMQSVQARRRRIAQAKDGIYLPRNRDDAREAGRFANPE